MALARALAAGGDCLLLDEPLSNLDAQLRLQMRDELRALVKETALARGKIRGLTLSAGVAGTRGDETAEQLFARADRALYQAKAEGRDRVIVG